MVLAQSLRAAQPPSRALASQTQQCPAAPYGVQHTAPGAGRTVALTFDDGPGPSTTAILEVLDRSDVTATFFNLGVNPVARPQDVRAEAARGLTIGNHTWDHARMTTLPASGQAAEMDRATAQQVATIGTAPCVFRPPYGSYNGTTLQLAQARHMAVWNWSGSSTEDWKANGSGSQYWIDRIVSRAIAGGAQQHPVILMHNSSIGNPATVAALPTIIDFYRTPRLHLC